ncbi:DegV family protein [Salipaludibacillus agaradhaerens]|uniref:DegV family protein n=1 Tax=Salipaludibacillus agaradhaerens TaxID=76935 RepID=UPI002151DB5F|nr:DegV family protein [Salipaludibacillus agaradhaerens]MCR6107115.1 DegV family protein [Salipaludibacillus agaradhaerens]MCR6119146.1 DegV family protein [Salipaludibacillus agaradhaerens]UJW58194.1 DegV family protein [Bacillus sp. A116_S68]
MGNVKIVTDSTADIPYDLQRELDISVVPLKVHFGEDETYEDGVDLTADEFYKKLASTPIIPTTSQPTPYQFETEYKRLYEEEKSDIISIHLSSKLSGTFQSAYIASQTLGEDIPVSVIDSKRASYAIGVIVVEVAALAKRGASKEECLARLDDLLKDTSVFFMVDTLEYLEKNGRIGKASAILGSLLKIKPILSLNEAGEVYPFEKVRGYKKAVNKIIQEFEERYGSSDIHVGISHAQAEEAANSLMSDLRNHFSIKKQVITNIGPVIGTHVGPGTISVSVTKMTNN